MNPLVLSVVAALITLPQDAADPPGLSGLFDAIRQVETGGAPNHGRHAVGDRGRSLGPYQISRAYWQDSGLAGAYDNVRDAGYAQRVMLAYWTRYCPAALARRDFRTLARIHNGGPSGCRKAATLNYWKRVSRHLAPSAADPEYVP